MRFLCISFFILYSIIATYGQGSTPDQVLSLLDKYSSSPDIEVLSKAKEMLDDFFTDDKNRNDEDGLFAKVRYLTYDISREDFELPDDAILYIEDINSTFRKALKQDEKCIYRYRIHKNLYTVKSKLLEFGRQYYEAIDYEQAYPFYDGAVSLNQTQIDFPRVITPDTTTIYTAAAAAYSMKNDEEAIKHFQRLVDYEYNRPEVYDYLIRLYRRNKFDVKAKKVEIKKKKLFPELKQN